MILLLFVGGLFTTTTVYAEKPSNESWLLYGAKTMWKSDANFSVGVGFDLVEYFKSSPSTPSIFVDFIFAYKNIYLGSIIRQGYITYDDKMLDYDSYKTYVGYGINFGNIYELAHKSDNVPHKILKRITLILGYGYVNGTNWIIQEYDEEKIYEKFPYNEFEFISNVEIKLINYKNFGLNYHYYYAVNPSYTKYHTLNIAYNF